MQPHRLVGALALAVMMTGLWAGQALAADSQPGIAPPAGSDPSSWSPVPVTPTINGTVVTAFLGQSLVFTGFPATAVVETSNGSVALVRQAIVGESTIVDGVTTPGAVTNPALQTLGLGAAQVVVRDGPTGPTPGTPLATFVLQVANVTGKASMLNREPLMLNADVTRLTLNETGERLQWDFPRYTVMSDNDSVLTSTGYPERRVLTAVGYGTARIIVSRGGKELARLKVIITRTPRFEFRLPEKQLTTTKIARVIDVSGTLAQPLPASVGPPTVCAYHVIPRTKLGCATVTTAGAFTISARVVPGTAVVEYGAGGGKGSAFFSIGIDNGDPSRQR